MKPDTALAEPRKTISAFIPFLLSLFTLLVVLFMYAFLHESGHALVGLFAGQRLTEFHIDIWKLEAHVGMVGNLTRAQSAIQSMAGAGLPLLVWFVFLCFMPRKSSFSLELLKLIGSMTVLNTLLAWIFLPILALLGKAPADDVTNFLQYSQIPPAILVLIAVVLYASGWVLFLSKIDGLRNELLLFRITEREKVTAGLGTTLPSMTAILALSLIFTFMFNAAGAKNSLEKYSAPQDFASIAQIDLSTHANVAETLVQFSLDEPGWVGVFVVVRNIDTTYFDLRVIGPDGYSSNVLHGEGYKADQDGGLWQEQLSPGTYQLVLTSHQSPGTVSVYMKTP